MKRSVLFVFTILMIAAGPAISAPEAQRAPVARRDQARLHWAKARRSIVKVEVREGEGQGNGTGFVWKVQEGAHKGKWAIVTNAHVARDADRITLAFRKGRADAVRVKGELYGASTASDVAMVLLPEASVRELQRKGVELRALEFGSAEQGEPVAAEGYGGGRRLFREEVLTDKRGAVLDVPGDMFRGGNSGGPMLGETGKVVGLVARISRLYSGPEVGEAVEASVVREAVRAIERQERVAFDEVQHARIGFGTANAATPELLMAIEKAGEALDVRVGDAGLPVVATISKVGAAHGKLQLGDVIVRAQIKRDGRTSPALPLEPEDVPALALKADPSADAFELLVWRTRDRRFESVTLDKLQSHREHGRKLLAEIGLQTEVVPIEGKKGDESHAAIKAGTAIKIKAIEKGSPAESLLKAEVAEEPAGLSPMMMLAGGPRGVSRIMANEAEPAQEKANAGSSDNFESKVRKALEAQGVREDKLDKAIARILEQLETIPPQIRPVAERQLLAQLGVAPESRTKTVELLKEGDVLYQAAMVVAASDPRMPTMKSPMPVEMPVRDENELASLLLGTVWTWGGPQPAGEGLHLDHVHVLRGQDKESTVLRAPQFGAAAVKALAALEERITPALRKELFEPYDND